MLGTLGCLVRRILDIVLGAVACLVVFGPILVALIIVKLMRCDPAPWFYREKRIGLNSAEFVIWKFGTMFKGAGGSSYTLLEDKRVTPLGEFLRDWQLDELPQVWNVFKGNMSWGGYRPYNIPDSQRLEKKFGPKFTERYQKKPGFFVLANALHRRASGFKDEKDFFERHELYLEVDLRYGRHPHRWLLDLMAVWLLIRKFVRGAGSRLSQAEDQASPVEVGQPTYQTHPSGS